MPAYLIKRLLGAIPTLFIIAALAFFLMRAAPGGPFDSERKVTPEVAAYLNSYYHFDKSLPEQFGIYLWNVAQGDLGPSFKYKDRTVNQLIAEGLPISASLGLLSMLVALIFGVALGGIAAMRQKTVMDHTVMSLALLGICLPSFVLGPILVLNLAVYLNWLPAGGWWITPSGQMMPSHLILPVLTLAMPQIAYIARMVRGGLIETLSSPFIRTARAKGISETRLIFVHALKPAFLPVLSYLGPALAGVLTGSVVVERIYGLPGIGSFFVDGATNRDYTLVMGVVLLYGIFIIVFNLLVDILYAKLDPRIQQS